MIDIDLHLDRGSFALDAKLRISQPVVGLFGPSGSGKSTLLAMLAGLIKPDGGRFAIDGECLFDAERGIDVPTHRRRIGLVFQDSRLFPHLSVRSNLVYGLNLLGKQRRLELAHIVELLEIGHLLKQHPHQLSGGEKQRVALGRALLASPRLLLLDEPLAALDTRLKNQILPFLRRVKEQTQIPMIYVSHAVNEVLHLTQTMAIIEGGSILASGDFHEVIKDDRVLSLAHSLGLDNVIEATVAAHDSEFGYTLAEHNGNQLLLPYLDVPPGAAISISVPATNIALAKARQAGITIQNQLPGVVTAIRQVDHRVLVSVDIGCVLIAEVTAKAVHDLGMAPGDQVYCLIKAQAMRYLGTFAN
ncbi:MAG TPA: molybdenum ABC transporter ATP-binding protein [Methylophilaceae bacterium]|nr:molybdenum ABC transporter ATP-binding protein [Methylophilaceae bacterium]